MARTLSASVASVWSRARYSLRRSGKVCPAVTMRSALSAALILALAAAPLTGCASAAGPRQLRSIPGTEPPHASDWSRVLELPPASAVMVTVRGSEPRMRSIARVDDSTLTVLDLSGQALPGPAARILRQMAEDHPESFVLMAQGGTFQQDNVRIGRDGVFVGDRQVAAFNQVVETIARAAVVEIRGPVVARGSVLGAVVGAWLGFSVGVVPALGGASADVAWSALVGAIAAGGFLGFHWSSHRTEGLVYRASVPPSTIPTAEELDPTRPDTPGRAAIDQSPL